MALLSTDSADTLQTKSNCKRNNNTIETIKNLLVLSFDKYVVVNNVKRVLGESTEFWNKPKGKD